MLVVLLYWKGTEKRVEISPRWVEMLCLWKGWITTVVLSEFVAINFIHIDRLPVGNATQSHNTLPYVKFGYKVLVNLTPFVTISVG